MSKVTYLVHYRRTAKSRTKLVELTEEQLGPWMQVRGKNCYSVFFTRFESDATAKGGGAT